ncbi:A/G-specific adenine glycosylase [soil metagenome]
MRLTHRQSAAIDQQSLAVLSPGPKFSAVLLKWYDRARRDLPWRVPLGSAGLPDPYYVLLSELMLQQTQVATVVPYFHRFIARFPTIAALAAADEQEVLRLWQGLGYYSRARNLHHAAKKVMADFGGALPKDVESLLTLPGVGRYTAGAIASLAFDTVAPILDGNVIRVVSRLDHLLTDPREREAIAHLWTRAEQILPKKRLGDFNSALMELGATICTPRAPQCLICPVRTFCEAAERGDPESIPPPKKAKPTPLVKRWIFAIEHDGKWLIEQRPATGRWAGMWQFVTLEPAGRSPTPESLSNPLGVMISPPAKIGAVAHALTHRRYHFTIFHCQSVGGTSLPPRQWVSLSDIDQYPLSKPQLYVASLLKDHSASSLRNKVTRSPTSAKK